MTKEELEANEETRKHVNRVRELLNGFIRELLTRADRHDTSKFESPEVEVFGEFTPKLKGSTYGSDEYYGFLKDMKPALDHHYSVNRHHPEYYPRGVDDMNLVDLVEMLCDWKAATERHADGNISKSIKINTARFKLSDQLANILSNSVSLIQGEQFRADY